MHSVTQRVRTMISSLPSHVTLVVAAKAQSEDAVRAALQGGATVVGHNYVQEAETMIGGIGREAAHWSLIGHLQRNKVKSAVRLFDSIQTVDSVRLADAINRQCLALQRVLPILIEVNIGREPQKSGVFPEDVLDLAREIAPLHALRVEGLMTLGPPMQHADDLRPSFRAVRALLDDLRKARLFRITPHILSMGMSDSYRIALEEGATMIRLGSTLFGPRINASADSGDA